jgi:hypothetical protein
VRVESDIRALISFAEQPSAAWTFS